MGLVALQEGQAAPVLQHELVFGLGQSVVEERLPHRAGGAFDVPDGRLVAGHPLRREAMHPVGCDAEIDHDVLGVDDGVGAVEWRPLDLELGGQVDDAIRELRGQLGQEAAQVWRGLVGGVVEDNLASHGQHPLADFLPGHGLPNAAVGQVEVEAAGDGIEENAFLGRQVGGEERGLQRACALLGEHPRVAVLLQ